MAFRINSEPEASATRVRNGDNQPRDGVGLTLEPPHPLNSSDDEDRASGRREVSEAKPTKLESPHAALPGLELFFYISVIAFLFVYIPWYTYQLSKGLSSTLPSLRTGWSVFGHHKKDESSYQWTTFVSVMTSPAVILSYVAYIILGQLVILTAPQFRKCFMLTYSLLWIYLGLGRQVLTVLLLHAVIVYLVSHTRRPLLVWIVAVLAIATVYVDSVAQFQEKYLGDTFHGAVCIATSVLRLVCFGVDFCWNTKPEKPARNYNLFDLLLFNFYLPVFPYGPVIGYNTFLVEVNSEVKLLSWKEFKYICKELVRCLFWAVFTEACIHYLYFGAMTNHKKTRRSLTSTELSMVALLHLFFFQSTTLVFYSLSRTIALFDRIQAPSPPICILSIHFFRDMWKYFDRGLNALLTKYIYIPLGGSKHGLLRQSLAALMCFLFVAWWHGGTQTYFIWALLNWTGVQLEATVLAFSAHLGPLRRFQDRLSPPMLRRFYAFCAVPNYLFLAFSNLVFVIGPSKTVYFAHGMILNDWPWNGLCIYVAFYCCMQVVNEMERRIGKQKLLSKNYI